MKERIKRQTQLEKFVEVLDFKDEDSLRTGKKYRKQITPAEYKAFQALDPEAKIAYKANQERLPFRSLYSW